MKRNYNHNRITQIAKLFLLITMFLGLGLIVTSVLHLILPLMKISLFVLSFKGIKFIYISLLLISMAFFIQWLHESYLIVQSFCHNLSFASNWVVLCWLIPVFNCFLPYLILSEMYKESNRLLLDKQSHKRPGSGLWLVITWWIAWIGFNIVGYVFLRTYFTSDSSLNDLLQLLLWLAFLIGSFFFTLTTFSLLRMNSKIEKNLLIHKDVPLIE